MSSLQWENSTSFASNLNFTNQQISSPSSFASSLNFLASAVAVGANMGKETIRDQSWKASPQIWSCYEMLVESLWKAAMWRCHRWSLIERMSKLHQLAPRNQFMVKYSNVWILFNIFKLFELKHTAKWNGLLAGRWDINDSDQREVVAGQRWMAADQMEVH